MTIENKFFDKISISAAKSRKRKKTATVVKPDTGTMCCHPDCEEKATNRAPKGRGRDNDFLWFCVKHVREYNKEYNYFSGMDDESIDKFRKDASLGHRPTWKLGVNNNQAAKGAPPTHDPFEFMAARAAYKAGNSPDDRGRKLLNVERKSLDSLGLDGTASKTEIKTRFKALAKKHHPDVNGGDKSTEDRLREIIQAYNYLKSAGFC